MLFHLSSVSLSRPTRPKFIVLFPCIARAESVIATILYCNTVYTAVDCFAVYYCSIYIFLEWRNIFESCLLQIQLQIQQACPAQENSRLAFIGQEHPAENFESWKNVVWGLYFTLISIVMYVVETKDNLALS